MESERSHDSETDGGAGEVVGRNVQQRYSQVVAECAFS